MGSWISGICAELGEAHFRIFEFGDWHSTQNFFKQFFSGIFITIVMTGLDQDMMQKNLSCKSLKDAQKNMYTYGFAFTPVNFLFLALGVLLLTLAAQQNIQLPTQRRYPPDVLYLGDLGREYLDLLYDRYHSGGFQ